MPWRIKVTVIALLCLGACQPRLHRKEVKIKKLHNHRYAYYDDGSWWIYTDASGTTSSAKPSFVGGRWVRSAQAPRENEIEEEEEMEIQENDIGEPDASADAGGADGGDSGGDGGGGSE